MIILETPKAMRAWSLQQRVAGKSIGCVPTMGALHAGHMSLVEASVSACDVTVLTLFVNPTQFAPHEDFDQYPRTFADDCALAQTAGVAAIYAPTGSSMYPEHYATYLEVEGLQDGLCGETRPHFFRGVATVVAKLFNATMPDKAFFGLKDGQQFAVIARMARDLDMGVEVVGMPIVREADGLAMSSRNRYLSAQDRETALCLSRSLATAQEMMHEGERDAAVVLAAVRAGMRAVAIDYVSLVDAQEMTPVTTIEGPVMLAVAATLGVTRLIDNIRFDPQSCEVGVGHDLVHLLEGSLSC